MNELLFLFSLISGVRDKLLKVIKAPLEEDLGLFVDDVTNSRVLENIPSILTLSQKGPLGSARP